MNDGGGIKGAIGQMVKVAQDSGEAVKDEVGEALEQGAQAVISGPKPQPQDPQAQQKAQEEQAKRDIENKEKKDWAEATVERYKKIEEEQVAVRMKKKQEEQVKVQEEQQEKQEEQFEMQKHNQKSADMTAIQQAARRTEIKGGVGG